MNKELNQIIRTAITYNDVACIEKLILKKTNLNIQNELGWTPLILAVWEGRNKIVKLLVDYGVKLDIQDSRGDSALILAVGLSNRKGGVELVKLLISKGADVNLAEGWGKTPLMCSILAESNEVTKLLLNHPAINLKLEESYEGDTALSLAQKYNYIDAIELINSKGN